MSPDLARAGVDRALRRAGELVDGSDPEREPPWVYFQDERRLLV